jgi:hypothetical protein
MCLLLAAPPPANGVWRRPVGGDVVGSFRHRAATPFAAGQRRGVELAAAPGEPVHAVCTGRVTYAGAVPGFGLGVSIRCGALTATELRVGAVTVRRGMRVAAGSRIAVAGVSGSIRLGARRTPDRFGYVDPMTLIGDVAAPRGLPPAGVAPRGRRPRVVAPPPSRPWPLHARHGRGAAPVPRAAWLGLGLLAGGIGTGGLVVRARTRRLRRAGLLVEGR